MAMTLILATLFAQAQPVPAQGLPVDAGRAEWSSFQRMESRLLLPNPDLVERIELILANGGCSLAGQRPQRFDFTVNYAVRFDRRNQAERVFVEDIGCEQIELLVGDVVNSMLRDGYFDLPRGRAERWYTNSINFNLDA